MTEIKKMITNGYANFSNEVKNGEKVVYKKGRTKIDAWAAIITNYVTAQQFNRKFLDFIDDELEINLVKVGDVVNLRNEKKLDNTYSVMYDQYFLILDIDAKEITLEKYPSVAKAIKAQKIMNYASANVVPVPTLPTTILPSFNIFFNKN